MHSAQNNDDRIAYSVHDSTRVSGVGRTTTFNAIRAGHLKVRKLGRRTLILKKDLEEWLNSLPTTNAA